MIPTKLFPYIALCAALFACSGGADKKTGDQAAPNRFSDANIQQIYEAQDRRDPKTLLTFLGNGNLEYSDEAALAFASVQDTLAVNALAGLLKADTKAETLSALLYALGQTGHASAEEGIRKFLLLNVPADIKSVALEALGKCAQTPDDADFLADFAAASPEEKQGKAAGLYRAGLKKVWSPKGTEAAADLLASENTPTARFMAASYFARSKDLTITPGQAAKIIAAAKNDPDDKVKMVAVSSLKKITGENQTANILEAIKNTGNYLIKINGLRALSKESFAQAETAALAELRHPNPGVGYTAALYLGTAAPYAPERWLQIADSCADWRSRSYLLGLAVRDDKGANISESVKKRLETSKNPYEKGALLKALAKKTDNYPLISGFLKDSAAHLVVRTNAIEALAGMRGEEAFEAFASKNKKTKTDFAEMFKYGIQSGDVTLMGISAGAIRNPGYGYKSYFPETAFIKEEQKKLALPKDIETFNELQMTINFLEGKENKPLDPTPFNNPINWQAVKKISKNAKAIITTSKGEIEVDLFVDDAPGSVANFVRLAQEGFFDGKNFHRVEPNFVAQGGCPRGDGWGGVDYSIRSEFAPLFYEEGTLGMASAGKDTEGSQWFITHSPAPHLDGRYSIFGKVSKGMEAAHLIEIGDLIISVKIN